MKEVLLEKLHSGFSWIDLVNPEAQELQKIAQEYDLDSASVESCLQSRHLTRCHTNGKVLFVIDRAFDKAALNKGESIQDLTRKVALFLGPDFLITIRRVDQEFFRDFKKKILAQSEAINPELLLIQLLQDISNTFMEPIQSLEDALLSIEKTLYSEALQHSDFLKLYRVRRHSYVIKGSLLRKKALEKDLLEIMKNSTAALKRWKDQIDRFTVYTEEVYENSSFLMNLQISLDSQRANQSAQKANDVMKVLTLFSAFFLPLNLLAGIYGMNFEFMPELKLTYGYPMVICAMGVVSAGIALWFRKRGWLT